jgi:SEC-C motif-containing protein
MKNPAYLIATWHPTKRPAQLDFTPGQEWLLLRILASSTNGETAMVEFTARSRIGGRSDVLHEISRFVREGGHWFYVDGVLK